MSTHWTDCTLKVEMRGELDDIAEMFYDDEESRARDALKDLGWERLGSGKGREVWSVPLSEQEGPRGKPTLDVPCAVKFAVPAVPHHHSGKVQNNEEINQFEKFPADVTESDPPAVVPVKDWADDRQSWLSMPEVDAMGGTPMEAESRLRDFFWKCNDIHIGNVGAIDGHSVVIDYGLDCFEIQGASELAEDIASRLEDLVDVLTVEGDGESSDVVFRMPTWIGNTGIQPSKSEITVVRGRGPTSAFIYPGVWEADDREWVEESIEIVSDSIENDFFGEVNPVASVDERDDGTFEGWIDMDITTGGHNEPAWDEFMVKNFMERLIGQIESEFERARDPTEFAEDVRAEFGTTVDRAPDRRVGVDDRGVERVGGDARFVFGPPDDSPGFRQTEADSWVAVNGGFRELRAAFGPWREESPLVDALPSASDAVLAEVLDKWPKLQGSWEIGRVGQNLTIERDMAFTFTIADTVDDYDLTEDQIVDLYADVYEAATEQFPSAPGPGGPIQSDIDEFIEEQVRRASGLFRF